MLVGYGYQSVAISRLEKVVDCLGNIVVVDIVEIVRDST